MIKKTVVRIGCKRTSRSRQFKEFYEEWIEELKTNLLPLLRRSMLASSANLLADHVQVLHHHFLTYFRALDLAATHDVCQLLYPSWRLPLELPFLWLGDFHPSIYTNLLRSFVGDNNNRDENHDNSNHKGLMILMFPLAWKQPSETLISRIVQIECGLRLMVPSIVKRARTAQIAMADQIGGDWVSSVGRCEASKTIGEAIEAEIDLLVTIFLDANRLRKSVFTEIMGCVDVYQGALYLEGLAQFYVGFRDGDVHREFEQCKVPLSKNS